jgi:hypothetical protein
VCYIDLSSNGQWTVQNLLIRILIEGKRKKIDENRYQRCNHRRCNENLIHCHPLRCIKIEMLRDKVTGKLCKNNADHYTMKYLIKSCWHWLLSDITVLASFCHGKTG